MMSAGRKDMRYLYCQQPQSELALERLRLQQSQNDPVDDP